MKQNSTILSNAQDSLLGGNKSLKNSANTHKSHKLPKIALSLIFCSANIAFAEESGGFVGVGIGANSLTGKFIKDQKTAIQQDNRWKFTDTGFNVWINVGLRTNIATNHGLELVVRVPLMPPIKMIDEKATAEHGSYKYTFKQDYSILAKYTFSF